MQRTPLHPFAQAADIITSDQKDAQQLANLRHDLWSILRKLAGARQTQVLGKEVQHLSLLIYLSLTTFVGNRTLGEEYCDIVPIEDATGRYPSFSRRAGFIFSCSLFPYFLAKFLSRLLRRLDLAREAPKDARVEKTWLWVVLKKYLRQTSNLSVTSLYAVHLALFYLRGRYYHVSKQFFRLRYVYSKRSSLADDRGNYEVLGVLLLSQVLTQAILHLQNSSDEAPRVNDAMKTFSQDLGSSRTTGSVVSRPLIESLKSWRQGPAYCTEKPGTMAWIDGNQRRRCTLCLEFLKDPSVTTCGHVFCWQCVVTWIHEKPECPLCRQRLAVQHVLPMRC